MADFLEWFEGGGGGGEFDNDDGYGDEDIESTKALRLNRDVVLFAVDCRPSMFHDISVTNSGEKTSAFTRALRCAIKFYQDKVITSDRDLVGLVLYNTRERLNQYDFPAFYVFHELDIPSAARIQELSVLAAAGFQGAAQFKNFEKHIGCCDTLPSPAPQALFSDVLWGAQHMFRHLTSKTVAFRRLFVFTDNDNPASSRITYAPGSSVPIPATSTSVEIDKCRARMRDLYEAGIVLEVFAHGNEIVSDLPTVPASPPRHIEVAAVATAKGGPIVTPSTASSSVPASASITGFNVGHGAGGSSPPRSPSPSRKGESSGGFDRSKFWDLLLLTRTSEDGDMFGLGSHDSQSNATVSTDGNADYRGSVHVSSALAEFDNLLSDIRMKTYPQRGFASFTLQIGAGMGNTFPKMNVKAYIPIMKCRKPSFTWLDSATNAMLTTETKLVHKSTGVEVTPDEIRHAAKIGDSRVLFKKREVDQIKSTCATKADSEGTSLSGITIVAFKAASDVLKFKYSINKAWFLHPPTTLSLSEQPSLKLFAQLHRTLTNQKKVAIAEVVTRKGGYPKLVALVPSELPASGPSGGISSVSPSPIVSASASSTPYVVSAGATASSGTLDGPGQVVSGCGFHVIDLPYADDIRSLKFEEMEKPSDQLTSMAKVVIQKLSARYDPSETPNPALQRQYHVLQQLALMDDEGTAKPPTDYTKPDTSGMQKFASSYSKFNSAAFSVGYNAELIVPPVKPAKPPPTKDEVAAIDFDALEAAGSLSSLTIPYLRQYLKLHQEEAQGASLKAELIERVGAVVRKNRGVKRERED